MTLSGRGGGSSQIFQIPTQWSWCPHEDRSNPPFLIDKKRTGANRSYLELNWKGFFELGRGGSTFKKVRQCISLFFINIYFFVLGLASALYTATLWPIKGLLGNDTASMVYTHNMATIRPRNSLYSLYGHDKTSIRPW